MIDISICFVYFRNLSPENLEASLYSLWRQDFRFVREIIVLDNNTEDLSRDILSLVEDWNFRAPVRFFSHKHGDNTKTHAWSTNAAVGYASYPWIFFTRADYLLSFNALDKMTREVERRGEKWNGFVTGKGCHVDLDIQKCNTSSWRWTGPEAVSWAGTVYDYTLIDTGVWLSRRNCFDAVGGVDEDLTAWGHAQTHFQYKLHKNGVEFVQVPEVLFYHPVHGGEKDIHVANEQLVVKGIDLREMWARYPGPKIY